MNRYASNLNEPIVESQLVVELRPHLGRCFKTGNVVRVGQYRVYVDGVGVGFLSFKKGSTVCLTERKFSPVEQDEIIRQAKELAKDDSIADAVAMPPEVPPELLKPKQDEYERASPNDFNT